MLVRITVPDVLWKQVMHKLLDDDQKISTLVNDYLLSYVQNDKKTKEQKDNLPKEQLVATKAVIDNFQQNLKPMFGNHPAPKLSEPKTEVIKPVIPKSTGFSASLVNVEGKVKKISDQYSILLNDGRSFLEDDWDFNLDGRTFDFRPMRPNTLFDISIFEISDQTAYLELVQIEKEKSDHTTTGLNSTTSIDDIDPDILNEYMQGTDMTQAAPADFSDLPIPEFTRKV